MAKKLDNLAALDWDDSALIKAYDRGMSLRMKDNEPETPKAEKRNNKKKNQWKVGDYCRAVYYGDNVPYEAKIIAISDGICTVEFFGYDEEVDVEFDSLSKTHGKKVRKKQLQDAKDASYLDPSVRRVERKAEPLCKISSNAKNGSVSADDVRNENSVSHSPVQTHSRKKRHHRRHGNNMFDHSANYSAAENTFHSVHPVVHHNEMPPTSMMPSAPPIPPCSEVAQNPSICAMLTSWYMAGYYTGLHQAQKCCCQPHYCYRPAQNCCHH